MTANPLGRPGNPTTGRPSAPRLTAIYLRHHAAAAQGGLDLFRRAARNASDPAARTALAELATAVAEDRDDLLTMMRAIGVERRPWQERVVGWGETLGRLKPNGTLVRRSPLTDVVELEALCVAVRGKELGWRALRTLADTDDRLDADRLEELVRRAGTQQQALEPLRLSAVDRAMATT